MLDLMKHDKIMYSFVSDSVRLSNQVKSAKCIVASARQYPKGPIVRAATLLKMNSVSEVVDIKLFADNLTDPETNIGIEEKEGRLHCVNNVANNATWIKLTTLAKDCHSCNVQLVRTANGVFLKTIKRITPGEPLLMWFTHHLLGIMEIPFLTMDNIRDYSKYVCAKCNNTFNYPNPLKIHLVLNCDRLSKQHMWNTLVNNFDVKSEFTFSLNPGPTIERNIYSPNNSPSIVPANVPSTTGMDYLPTTVPAIESVGNSLSPSANSVLPVRNYMPYPNGQIPNTTNLHVVEHPHRYITPVPDNRHSAFRPYLRNNSNMLINSENITQEEAALITSYIMQQSQRASGQEHAAQMEVIMSNIGKSKNGHLCSFCGKVYTRKYGLKIHLRTHTGYKPLTCKYCSRAFGDPSNLNKHVRLHSEGDTPYKCEYCGKVSVRRRDLERHMKSRHQDMISNISDTSSDGNGM